MTARLRHELHTAIDSVRCIVLTVTTIEAQKTANKRLCGTALNEAMNADDKEIQDDGSGDALLSQFAPRVVRRPMRRLEVLRTDEVDGFEHMTLHLAIRQDSQHRPIIGSMYAFSSNPTYLSLPTQ